MRCLACNDNLTDSEATNKYPDTAVYIDLCTGCYKIAFEIEETEDAEIENENQNF